MLHWILTITASLIGWKTVCCHRHCHMLIHLYITTVAPESSGQHIVIWCPLSWKAPYVCPPTMRVIVNNTPPGTAWWCIGHAVDTDTPRVVFGMVQLYSWPNLNHLGHHALAHVWACWLLTYIHQNLPLLLIQITMHRIWRLGHTVLLLAQSRPWFPLLLSIVVSGESMMGEHICRQESSFIRTV